MRVAALDSSGLVASVAIVEDDNLLAEYTVNYKKTHSQTLLPMLDEIVRMIELELPSLDAIAVAAGPGSFTGLRIGAATAKGLGLALDKPLVAVPTVEALAYNLWGAADVVCPMMDARRSQVYTGLYAFSDGEMETLLDQAPRAVEDILERVNQLGRGVIFLGDGVPVYREKIESLCQVPHTYAPAHVNKQRAAAVGALALRYLREGKTQTAAEHQPIYLRPTQAEREREERLAREAEQKKEEPGRAGEAKQSAEVAKGCGGQPETGRSGEAVRPGEAAKRCATQPEPGQASEAEQPAEGCGGQPGAGA